MSIRYEIISDSCVYTIPYSISIVFICVMILYQIRDRHRVDGRAMRFDDISDAFESESCNGVSYAIVEWRFLILLIRREGVVGAVSWKEIWLFGTMQMQSVVFY